MAFKNFKEESKNGNWGKETNVLNGNITIEEINCGSLMRIADATEKMAVNINQLQNDLEMYKRWYEQEKASKECLQNSLRSYKGQITKLKKSILKY